MGEAEVNSDLQSSFHSPIEWACDRVTDSHPPTNKPCTVGRHRLGPEYVQISTPQTWPHPNTMRASGARALGGMFCNARATHTAKLCPKNTGAKTQKCWDKKSCAGSAGAKKVYAGHASHTLAHCFQEMSACMVADI